MLSDCDFTDSFLATYRLEGPNFEDTNHRVQKMWNTFFAYPEPNMTTFPSHNTELVILTNHETWGFCPHHLLPVKYTMNIGYYPSERVVGISKLARVANYVLRSLPLQEDIPLLIIEKLEKALEPRGCGVVVKGEHLCMRIRGVQSSEGVITTRAFTGTFLTDEIAREYMLCKEGR
jgi:GTP cyclohydrolase IA